MLRLLDGYEVQVPVKRAFRLWKPIVVFITADRCPADWLWNPGTQGGVYHPLRPEELRQLYRRFTHVECVNARKTAYEVLRDQRSGGGVLNTAPTEPAAEAAWTPPPNLWDLEIPEVEPIENGSTLNMFVNH